MRLALAALVLALASAPLHAQLQKEPKKAEKKETDKKKASSPGPARPQDQRARERVPGDPPPDHRKHSVSRDAQPPKGPPSPAIQFQQKQLEQRQTQQQNRDAADRRTLQCTARPVCGGGGYGRCASVQQTYRGGTEQSRRQDIINDCIQANTPDTCQCAVQCRRVAHCSIF